MSSLAACTVNETEKIFLKKKTLFFLIVTTLIPLGALLVVNFFQRGLGILPVSAGDFPIWILDVFTNILLPLSVAMAAIDIFTGEFGDRTIKITLLRPISRFKIFFGKIIALAIYIIINLAIIFLVSSISFFFLEGSGRGFQALLNNFMAYSVALFPMLLIAIMSVFVAQFFKNSSGALVILILMYFGMNILSTILPSISNLMITSYTDWHLLWTAGGGQVGRIFTMFMFILSYSIIFLASGFYLFDRKEL